jgi:hypothetical protein
LLVDARALTPLAPKTQAQLRDFCLLSRIINRKMPVRWRRCSINNGITNDTPAGRLPAKFFGRNAAILEIFNAKEGDMKPIIQQL